MFRVWWKTIGNVSQIITASGALVFGIASVFVALAAQNLQREQTRDAARGRTAVLLTKYIESIATYGSEFRYGLYCIGHVQALAIQLADKFDETVGRDKVAMFSSEIANRSLLKSEEDIRNYDKCIFDFNGKSESLIEDRILRRFVFPLNVLTNVLLEWRNPNLPSLSRSYSEQNDAGRRLRLACRWSWQF